MANFSVVQYFAEHEGYRCGYCKSPDTNYSHGMWAHNLDVRDYQDLIDRGWRRSGKYCYKPTMNVTCCPMYTIRCSALDLKLSKSQKKVLKKVTNFLVHGKRPDSQSNAGISPERDMSDVQNICDIPDSVIDKFSSKANTNMDISSINISAIEEKLEETKGVPETSGNANPTDSPEQSSAHKEQSMKKGVGPDPNRPVCRKAKDIRQENKRQKLMKRVAQGEITNEKLEELLSIKKKCPPESKSLEDFLKEAEVEGAAHQLRIKTVRSGSDEHKKSHETEFATFQSYQMTIHKEKSDECNESGFQNFLINSPLMDDTSTGPPTGYGSFHQQYWLDKKLIAVGVIDILPSCVSSVYLFYDPEYSFLSLGTYSALREVAFTRELSRICPDLQYYYMGFYIHSCPKMRYKAQYYPSSLLCPETYIWVPYEKCVPKLNASKYTRLNPDTARVDVNGRVDMSRILVLHNRKVKLYPVYAQSTSNSDADEVHQYASLVGKKCYKRMLLFRS